MKDMPDNSHIFSDFIVDFQSYGRVNATQWTSNNVYTYLLLDKAEDMEKINQKLDPITRKYVGPEIKQFIVHQLRCLLHPHLVIL